MSQTQSKDGLIVQYLNSRVYELMCDTATGKTTCLYKQYNNALPVLGLVGERHYRTSYKQIVERFTDYFKTTNEPVKFMRGYPLVDKPVGTSADDNERRTVDEDWVGEYTIYFGWAIEERRDDPNKPIVVKGDTSPEAIDAARTKALTPYTVIVPFVFVLPVTNYFSWEIRQCHVPEGSVTYYDSTKQEQNPADNDELAAMPLDPTAPIVSPEDRDHIQDICATIDRLLHDGKDPNDTELIVKTLNAEWCHDVGAYHRLMSKFALPQD